jgi:BirA family biotin operon repressor/biotin-[acetyl-CoA-carboxylase] ligase
MDAAQAILRLLFDRREGYVAAEELAAAGRIPRRRLEAVLGRIRARGQRLEVSPAHGVRLVRPAALNAGLIERDLDTRRVGRHVIVFAEVDSTNDVAFDAARRPGADGLVVAAEAQRRGRGRQGRPWRSAPRRNLLFTALLLEPVGPAAQGPVTIAAGLAAAEGIEASCGLRTELKWPNDVTLGGAKLGGVLVEVRRLGAGRAVAVGVGLNVNAAPTPEEVSAPAACLADALGRPVERIDLLRAVLRRLDHWVGAVGAGRTDALHDAWAARCGMLGRRCTVLCDGRRHAGRVLDVDPFGGLVLGGDDGSVRTLPAATSTVVA